MVGFDPSISLYENDPQPPKKSPLEKKIMLKLLVQQFELIGFRKTHRVELICLNKFIQITFTIKIKTRNTISKIYNAIKWSLCLILPHPPKHWILIVFIHSWFLWCTNMVAPLRMTSLAETEEFIWWLVIIKALLSFGNFEFELEDIFQPLRSRLVEFGFRSLDKCQVVLFVNCYQRVRPEEKTKRNT